MRLAGLKMLAGLVALSFATVACSGADSTAPVEEAGYTLYLVRHAEKVLDVDNPPLTPEGEQRAAKLADLLEDAGIEHIYSTDYLRTETTAAPLAVRLDMPIEFYDPDETDVFVEKLIQRAETALIVGHSNTTPELVDALGGDGGEPIVEATEYDRLYVLTGVGAEEVITEIRRYGAPNG
ncbi:MAG: phosphoglycerate mutase family protein [Henriciella sp.]